MADWYGTSRSNYVKLKNPATSVATLEQLFEVDVVHKDGLFAILSQTHSGDTPGCELDEDNAAFFEEHNLEDVVSLLEVIHLFLEPEPDNVFVWITAGAEKLRYITGHAVAISPEGQILNHVSLDDIYDDTEWTHAEY